MSMLAEQLRRLRSQAGVPLAKPARAPGQSALQNSDAVAVQHGDTAAVQKALHQTDAAAAGVLELGRLRRLLAQRPAVRGVTPPPSTTALRGTEIAPGLYLVEQHYAAQQPTPLLPPRWPEIQPVARERFLCFDTETTGLAGGSGTRAFMIGAADWRNGQLRVRQLYLAAMGAEAAMLQVFAGWLDAATVLVSYNGRSYDAPLLATRYRLQRLPDALKQCAHVDLLHPVRRAYRGCWENCRLATVERQLLHIVREDDLPGSEAPAAWRTWLRQGNAVNFMRVLEHNRQDVVTLARLLEHMAGERVAGERVTSEEE